MVQIRRVSFWKQRYAVTDAQGFASEWRGRFGREGASGLMDGERYTVRSDGRKRFVLDGAGGVLASAERARRPARTWTLSAGGADYEFTRPSAFRSSFELRSGGQAIGTVRRKRRNVVCDLPDALPLSVQAFLGFLAMAIWHRENTAASGGAIGATN